MRVRLAALLLAVCVGVGVGLSLALAGGRSSRGTRVGGAPPLSVRVTSLPAELGQSPLTAAALANDGTLVLGSERGVLRLFGPSDVALRGGLEFGFHIPMRVEGLAVSGNGSTVVAGSDNGGAGAWSIHGGVAREIATPIPYEAHEALALNDDGSLLAVLGGQQILVYDLPAGRRIAALPVHLPLLLSGNPTIGEAQQAYAFGFNAASTRIALVGLLGAEAWSVPEARRLWSMHCGCGATDVALSDNATFAVFGTTGGLATVLDLRDRHVVGEVTVTAAHGDETDAVMTDDAGRMVVAASKNALRIWQSSSQLTPPSIERLTGERIESIAMSANGDRLLVGTAPRYTKYEAPGLGVSWVAHAGPAWLVRLSPT
jgi:WD40 repeat protein